MDIPGLLGRLAGLPGAINQGLLGSMPVDPRLGLDPQMLQQARQGAGTDFAMGLVAGGNNPQTLLASRRGATEGFRNRLIDIMREQEMARMMESRDEQQKKEAAYRATLPAEVQPVADVAGLSNVANQQVASMFAPAEQQLTDDIKEYNLAVKQGFKGTIQDWIIAQKKAGAASTTVNLPPEQSSFLKGVGEKAAGQLDALQTSADSAAKMLGSINKLKPLLSDPAFIAGTLGDARLVVAKALGLPGATDTQAYFAAVGEQVAERIKAFGAGTGLSDADREFAKQIAAGSIELTPAAIRKIIDINERSANELLDKYHDRRKFYSKENPEVVNYFPEITVPGATGVDALLDKYAPRGQ